MQKINEKCSQNKYYQPQKQSLLKELMRNFTLILDDDGITS